MSRSEVEFAFDSMITMAGGIVVSMTDGVQPDGIVRRREKAVKLRFLCESLVVVTVGAERRRCAGAGGAERAKDSSCSRT